MERRGLAAAQLSEAVGHVVREAVESVFDDAVRLAEDGRTIAQIQTHLKARGLNDLSAAEMARRAWEMPTEQRNRAGQRNMISGAALCFVGLLPTAATYFVAASSAGGGRYALFWGMVLGGLLQFLRGVRPGQSLANTLLRKKNPPCPSEIEEPRMSACAPRPLQKRCSGSWAYPAG
jgi:hypothetical protein